MAFCIGLPRTFYAQGLQVNTRENKQDVTLYGATGKIVISKVSKFKENTANTDFLTGNSINLIKGQTYSISIADYQGVSLPSYVISLDYNVKSDSGKEKIQIASLSKAQPSVSFMVPDDIPAQPIKLIVTSVDPKKSTGKSITDDTRVHGQVTEEYKMNITNAVMKNMAANEESVTVYPNPVKNIINIRTRKQGDLSYQLLNAGGQVVLSGTINNNSINVEAIPSGAYILEVVQQNNVTTHKLIKQ